jgi:hypothetical protein
MDPDLSEDLKAVDPGKNEVEEDDPRDRGALGESTPPVDVIQRFFAVARHMDRIHAPSLVKRPQGHLHILRVVLD